MFARYEIVQVVDGRVFDEEWYERTAYAADMPAGFYALLWPLDQDRPRREATARFVGPFSNARMARSRAHDILAGIVAPELAAGLRDIDARTADVARGE